MKKGLTRHIILSAFIFAIAVVGLRSVEAQDTKQLYSKMAPIEQYLMERSSEIALAKSAAPAAISDHAEIWTMGRRGFEKASAGANGFVCIVGRGWSSAADPDFWNPKVRVPMCANASAARSYLLAISKITELGLAGFDLAHVNSSIATMIARKELPAMESGAMCYMMGKQGYGGDVAPHWPPHLMFFYSDVDPAIWGANTKGSPIMGLADPTFHLTQFVIPVDRYSDGSPAPMADGHKHS